MADDARSRSTSCAAARASRARARPSASPLVALVAPRLPVLGPTSELDARVRRDRLLLHLRDDVEPAGRLRRHGQHRAAGLLRPRRLRDAGAGQLRRRQSLRRGAARARWPRRWSRCRCPSSRSGCRAATSRSAPGSSPKCSGSSLRQRLGGRRRLGHQPDRAARHRARRRARASTFWMALACVVAAIALVYLFLRSKRGLALLAIRDNEVAAESQGIDVRAHEARRLRGRGLRRAAWPARCTSSATCASARTPPSASTGPRSRSSWW